MLIKAIAELILQEKMDELRQEVADAKAERKRAESDMEMAVNEKIKIEMKKQELIDTVTSQNLKIENLEKKIESLEEQNAKLRKYYSLDCEPSQDLKDKMYLDEKYQEMKKKIEKLENENENLRQYHIRALNIPFVPFIPYDAPMLPAYMQSLRGW